MPRRSAVLLVGALLGGLAGVPIGMHLGRQAPEPATAPSGTGALRSHYSPEIYSDRTFVDRLRPTIEAMERGCRANGDHCEEARAARRRLTDLEHGR